MRPGPRGKSTKKQQSPATSKTRSPSTESGSTPRKPRLAKPSSPSSPATTPGPALHNLVRSVKEQVRLYGLTTMRAVNRAVAGGHEGTANQVLRYLADTGELHRRTCASPLGPVEYFAPSPAELPEPVARRRLSILAYACCQREQRPLLPPDKFQTVIGSVALKGGRTPSPWRPCYLHRANARVRRLSLIRTADSPDLQAVVGDLDALVDSAEFRPWLPFMENNAFVLTVLVSSRLAQAAELSRWVRRRPPVCRGGSSAQPVEVFVYAVPHFLAA